MPVRRGTDRKTETTWHRVPATDVDQGLVDDLRGRVKPLGNDGDTDGRLDEPVLAEPEAFVSRLLRGAWREDVPRNI